MERRSGGLLDHRPDAPRRKPVPDRERPQGRSHSRPHRLDPMQKTAIIVPCYNVAGRLDTREFVRTAKAEPNLHFLFVNDGSADGTPAMLSALCADNPRQLSCLMLDRNMGKAEAVRRGFLSAFEKDFVNIGFWDADLATPLSAIPDLCSILDDREKSVAIGSRVRLLGRTIERHPWRHYLGRVFATCASLVLGLPVYDTQCGAKIFRNGEDLREVFGSPFRSRWIFDVEILARFLVIERRRGTFSLKNACVEHPLREWRDIPGSKIRAADALRALFELVKIAISLRRA